LIRAEVNRGWQFRSEITNGLGYDSRDNVFNPTRGLNTYLSISNVGQLIGGQSHFDRYNPVVEFYHSWFDYTFGGLFRSNTLRRWKVVQEFRMSHVLMFERVPKYNRPDPFSRESAKLTNPYIQQQDLQFLGGYESLRGWNFQDILYPREWRNGANHRLLFNTELRFPIEPNFLWFVLFLDAGSLYEEVGKWVGTRKDDASTFQQRVAADRAKFDPVSAYLRENYNLLNLKKYEPDQKPFVREDPELLILKNDNISLERLKYSWGVGLRVQIPVLPLRLYFAQRLYYTGDPYAPFNTYNTEKNFQFVFGIGDFRF
jgi:outer membrane protein insertion porin family